MTARNIIQVKTAKCGPLRQAINSSIPTTVHGMAIRFTPFSPRSIIIIEASIITSATYVWNYSVYKDGSPTVSTAQYSNSSTANANCTMYNGENDPAELWCHSLIWTDRNYSIDPRTYDIRVHSRWSGTNRTIYINNRSSNGMASFSHMVISEVLWTEY